MSYIVDPNKIPPPNVPLAGAGGLMTQPWYQYFLQIDAGFRKASALIGTGSAVVATLPPIMSVPVGATAFVTDATATTFNSIVAGGGTNAVNVHSDGTNWRIG